MDLFSYHDAVILAHVIRSLRAHPIWFRGIVARSIVSMGFYLIDHSSITRVHGEECC